MPRIVPFSDCGLQRYEPATDAHFKAAEILSSNAKFVAVHGTKSLFNKQPEKTSAVFLNGSDVQKYLNKANIEETIFAIIGTDQNGVTTYAVDLSAADLEEIEKDGITAAAIFSHVDSLSEDEQLHHSTQMAIARGLVHWHSVNNFCSKCGSKMAAERMGTARRCTNDSCKQQIFPRQDPAIITSCAAGDWCLLGRKSVMRPGWYTTVAGFIEIGETVESTVVREIQEETGVDADISSVQFVCSQPWPFPQSYMLAFICQALQRTPPTPPDAFAPVGLFEGTQFDHEKYGLPTPTPEHPLITVGGGWVKDPVSGVRTWLPLANPPTHELEDARWFHKSVLAALLREETRPALGQIQLPMKTGTSYMLIREFAFGAEPKL